METDINLEQRCSKCGTDNALKLMRASIICEHCGYCRYANQNELDKYINEPALEENRFFQRVLSLAESTPVTPPRKRKRRNKDDALDI